MPSLPAAGAPLLQVAIDGWWEHAAVLRLPATAGERARLLEGLTGDDVAAEVLWPGPPIVFVGARFDDPARLPLDTLAARGDWTPSEALAVLAGAPSSAVRAELGAVNAWRSVGPLPIALDADTPEIERALTGRPDLAACQRPVALEVVHEHAWWAIEVSDRTEGEHRVRPDRVAALLASARERA